MSQSRSLSDDTSKMSPSMDQFAYILQTVGYRSVVGYPYLTAYLHLLVSAIFPIYAGAHASLSRPASAAKPPKGTKKRGHDDDDDDAEDKEQAMEGLRPLDAILLPLFAGLFLASLYFLIKWLEDPALLNQILNCYLAVFGVWSLARMFRDGMGIFTSFVFPEIYDIGGKVWKIDAERRRSKLVSSPSVERSQPVPGPSSTPPLPAKVTDALWTIRELPWRQLEVRIYIREMVQAQFKIGPQGVTSLVLTIAALLYFNLVAKPWWLTNILGFSFAYSSLQIISPTTSWTGTLILGADFIYDIYFVFFTPVMVTVATQLDIPAKLIFPTPSRPNEDPTRPASFMLGLGDIILPGMMIGFALRFDLYLFYLRKQIPRSLKISGSKEDAADDQVGKKADDSEVVKATWYPATGGWGERFWTSKTDILKSKRFKGIIFPKTYFRASLIGYFVAMICTLGVMNIYDQAQPALLYLVPGVLGSLWGTALVKGDIKTLWAFNESEDDQAHTSPSKSEKKKDGVWKKDAWMDVDWKSLFLSPSPPNRQSETPTKPVNDNDTSDPIDNGSPKRLRRSQSPDDDARRKPKRSSSNPSDSTTTRQSNNTNNNTNNSEPQHESQQQQQHSTHASSHKAANNKSSKKEESPFERHRTSEFVFISINLPPPKATFSSPSSKDGGSNGGDE